MIRLEPTAESRQAIDRMLHQLEELSRPPADAIEPVQQAIRIAFDRMFQSEGAAGGQPWAQLAPYTIKERIRLGFFGAHPILERTGKYRASFAEPDSPNHYSSAEISAGRWMIEEGSTDPRADLLEYGDSRTPPRPVTIIGEEGESRLTLILDEMFAAWLDEE